MSDRRNKRRIQDFLQYLRGETTGRERNLFERELEGDPFAKEAMEGFERLSEGQLEEDLLALHDRLRRRTTRRRRVAWYGMAAAVASILIVGTLFLKIHDFNPTRSQEKGLSEEARPGRVPEATDIEPSPQPEVQVESQTESQPESQPEIQETPSDETVQGIAEKEQKGRPTEPAEKEAAEQPSLPVAVETGRAVHPSKPDEVVAVEAGERVRSKNETPSAIVVAEKQPVREITGMVVSAEDSAPLPGASVAIMGDEAVSITDQEGRFSIPMDHDSQTMVVASYAGMETEEFALPTGREPALALQPVAIEARPENLTVEEMAQPEGKEAKGVARAKMETGPVAETVRTPEPAGGYITFYRYIEENTRFPLEDTVLAEAVVILQFTVTLTGDIKDIEPLSSPGDSFTAEAVRLMKEGPRWIPAMKERTAINKEVRLRIVLKK